MKLNLTNFTTSTTQYLDNETYSLDRLIALSQRTRQLERQGYSLPLRLRGGGESSISTGTTGWGSPPSQQASNNNCKLKQYFYFWGRFKICPKTVNNESVLKRKFRYKPSSSSQVIYFFFRFLPKKANSTSGWGTANPANQTNAGTQQWNNNQSRPPATGPGPNSQDGQYFAFRLILYHLYVLWKEVSIASTWGYLLWGCC